MLVTLPSGQTMLTPIDPRTWTEQADAVTGTPVMTWDLERQISSAVAFHRRRPLFQGHATGSQSVPTATWTAIPLTEYIDVYGGHDDDANPSRVTSPITASGDGWYLCTGYVPWRASAAGGLVIAGLRKDGGTILEGAKLPSGAVYVTAPLVCDLIHIPSFSYIELMGYQNSGGALSTEDSTTKTPTLTIRWACDAAGDVVADPGTPRTWTAADVVTADSAGPNEVPFNTHIRDVLRYLRYPPACRIDTFGTAQTIPSGAWTSISFTFDDFDNYSGHDLVTTPSRYVVQRPGTYFVYGLAALSEVGSTGYRASRLLVNGTTAYAGTSTRPATSTLIGTALPATATLRLEAGDYVELQVIQTQGSALAVKTGAGDASRLVMLWRGL